MGITVVLIFYAVGLTVAASAGAVLLAVATYLLTRNATSQRKRAVIASGLFPFICVAYAGGWFVTYAVVNYEVFQRDPGLGDSWETPLPNGYALLMIDTTDQGTVYDPKTQAYRGSVTSREDAVFGVRQLQVSGKLIFGARDSGYFDRIGQESKLVDSYFELDTAKYSHAEFKSLDQLRSKAAADGVTLNLRDFESVFSDYRTTWFDYFAGIILIAVPMLGFLTLARWVWKIRQSRTVA